MINAQDCALELDELPESPVDPVRPVPPVRPAVPVEPVSPVPPVVPVWPAISSKLIALVLDMTNFLLSLPAIEGWNVGYNQPSKG